MYQSIIIISHTLISVELYPHRDMIHPLRWPYSQVSCCDHWTKMLINDGVEVKVCGKNLKNSVIVKVSVRSTSITDLHEKIQYRVFGLWGDRLDQ